MLKTISVSALALAAVGFAAPAMAASQTANVGVDITVSPIVSVWTAHNTTSNRVALNITGGPNNAAAAEDDAWVVNNVPFNLAVNVTGSMASDLFFYVSAFNTKTAATVASEVNADFIQTPAMKYPNTHEWTNATLGTSKTLISNETTLYQSAALPIPLVYIVTAPFGPPAVTGTSPYNLTVTYTITSIP